MSIVNLPPSNHINALRAFFSRFRRSRTVPSQKEFTEAEDQLRALEKAINNQQKDRPNG